MTVLSGRATVGASSVLRTLLGGVFAFFGLIIGGCGNHTLHYGTVIVTVTSDPGPFQAYITDMSAFYLTQTGGGIGYSYQGVTGLGKTIDFTRLSDRTELFGAPAVIEGTYASATFSFNYGTSSQGNPTLAAQLYLDVNGQATKATLVDPNSTANPPAVPGVVTYTVKFDPSHPLVVKGGAPAFLDFHFDTSAASLVSISGTTASIKVRPFMTASTQPPTLTRPLRARGEFVTVNKGSNTITINSVAFFEAPSYVTGAQGAIQIQPTDQTTYDVNGTVYRGAAGLAAIATLPINTTISAYGTLGSLSGQEPIFNATQVYAGTSTQNVLATLVTGTIASRSGSVIHVRNAEMTQSSSQSALAANSSTGLVVSYAGDVAVTVGSSTVVHIDGDPEATATVQSLSIGQQVFVEGLATSADTTSGITTAVDASAGLIRATSTPLWGTLTAAQAGSATVDVLSLGGVAPSALTFTGTGSASGADADPTAYAINTGSVDLSAQPAGSLFRFDGLVTPFGSAPPDFTASTATDGSATDQVLAIEWTGTGTTAPFLSTGSSGLVVNMSNAALGTTHYIQTGPSLIDLTNPAVTPTIVPDPSITGQFAIGNSVTSTGILMFNSFASYLTQLGTSLNGTNTILKLTATGKWNAATNTFTAYRINMVQNQ